MSTYSETEQLVLLAPMLALAIAKDKDPKELATLAAFLSTLSSLLAMLALEDAES